MDSFIEKAREFNVDPILIDIFITDLYDDNKSEEDNLDAFGAFIA